MKKYALLLALPFISSITTNAQDKILEGMGALGATAMYNSYVAIGAIADAYESAVYDDSTTISLMNEQIGLMDNLSATMASIMDSGELKDPADQSFAAEMIECFDGLSRQASLMIEYVDDLESDGTSFQDQREINWKLISKLLQIPE